MKVYNALLKNPDLSMNEKIILSKIESYSENIECGFYLTNEQLSHDLCLSIATVKRALSSLEEKGLIKRYIKNRHRKGVTIVHEKFNKILRITEG